ncbi:unnamed protein product [Sphenostylis stenocarpa]|uniref:Pectinesterase inhibitor domain-containing protein n=1 Tax=Sphenostylis stenocarpa TaxID=92480 RepID=A0AA86SK95_9FABA|nr:unnamed protein product [Sphenostylis stenocarpa]
MKLATISILLFTFSLIFISHAPLPSLGKNLHESLCDEVKEDKGRCLEVFKGDPGIAKAKDNFELSKLILEFALKKGIEAQNFLKEVMKTNPSPAIKQCATIIYDGVIESLKNSLGELGGDGQTSSYDVQVASDGPITCDKALSESNITNPSIVAFNRDILLLSNLAFRVIDKSSQDVESDLYAAKILANLIVMGGGILARAVVQAYRQALTNASKNGVAQETIQNTIRRASKAMTEQEARQILGVSKETPWEEVIKKYDNLFESNAKSGSFYLQSKVQRAKECLEEVQQGKSKLPITPFNPYPHTLNAKPSGASTSQVKLFSHFKKKVTLEMEKELKEVTLGRFGLEQMNTSKITQKIKNDDDD